MPLNLGSCILSTCPEVSHSDSHLPFLVHKTEKRTTHREFTVLTRVTTHPCWPPSAAALKEEQRGARVEEQNFRGGKEALRKCRSSSWEKTLNVHLAINIQISTPAGPVKRPSNLCLNTPSFGAASPSEWIQGTPPVSDLIFLSTGQKSSVQ